jgi:hypothetical protein
MAHIDRTADELSFLSSFFSREAKTGLFEALTILVGSVAISVFLIAALHMPLATQLPAAP